MLAFILALSWCVVWCGRDMVCIINDISHLASPGAQHAHYTHNTSVASPDTTQAANQGERSGVF